MSAMCAMACYRCNRAHGTLMRTDVSLTGSVGAKAIPAAVWPAQIAFCFGYFVLLPLQKALCVLSTGCSIAQNIQLLTGAATDTSNTDMSDQQLLS